MVDKIPNVLKTREELLRELIEYDRVIALAEKALKHGVEWDLLEEALAEIRKLKENG